MTDLAKMMSPIRDTIARTREKMEQIERLLITATEADKLDCTSAAECAVERARRMLAELNGKAGELPKPTPASPKLPCDCAECCGCKTLEEANAWLLANPGKAESHAKASTMRLIGRESLGDTIDRTLPPGFEVRKFPEGWYPIDYNAPVGHYKCWQLETSEGTRWSIPCHVSGIARLDGSCGYPTESAAYADKARWLKAAGVDWPEVTGPHGHDTWEIHTTTHWWDGVQWHADDDIATTWSPKRYAESHLPAACRAWVEMQKEAAR